MQCVDLPKWYLKCYFECRAGVSTHIQTSSGLLSGRSSLYNISVAMLPVIILKRLVPQQQVPEAIARWKGRHLCIHLGHLKS